MKIAIVGLGKMGREIESLVETTPDIQTEHVITCRQQLLDTHFSKGSIAIEFTTPQSALANIETLLKKQVPVIRGTTGWYDHMDQVKSWVKRHNGAFLYASNFSIGVHLFWKALEQMSQNLKGHEPCIQISETHHTQKKDRPSGTAITCQGIIQEVLGEVHPTPIQSIRKDDVFGHHQVTFETQTDLFEIHHHAKSRSGFAQGALACARWIQGRKGFFSIEDYILDI